MEEYEPRFGALYQDLRYKEKGWSRIVPFVFILKRVIFAYGCWYWKFQIISCTTTIGLLNVCFMIHVRPYQKDSQFYIEIFNELICMIFYTCL
jgi:hypothetical protein